MLQTLTVAAVLGAAGPVPAHTPTAPPPRVTPELTAAYHLRNVAADDAADAVVRSLSGTGRDVAIRVEAAANQLVVRGSVAAHARVAALVGELDRVVPQVHVAALVAEVPVGFLADCGLTTPVGQAGAGCFTLTPRELALFQTAFRLYPNRSVLSRPQLVIRDNQTGNLRVGQDFPVPGPVTQVGGQSLQQIDYRFAGTSVEITPRLMPDGKVSLRVGTQVSAPSSTPVEIRAGATAFPINVSTCQTSVLVPAGETVLIAHPRTGSDGKPAAVLILLTPTMVHFERR